MAKKETPNLANSDFSDKEYTENLRHMIIDSNAQIDDIGRACLYDFEEEIVRVATAYAVQRCTELATELANAQPDCHDKVAQEFFQKLKNHSPNIK